MFGSHRPLRGLVLLSLSTAACFSPAEPEANDSSSTESLVGPTGTNEAGGTVASTSGGDSLGTFGGTSTLTDSLPSTDDTSQQNDDLPSDEDNSSGTGKLQNSTLDTEESATDTGIESIALDGTDDDSTGTSGETELTSSESGSNCQNESEENVNCGEDCPCQHARLSFIEFELPPDQDGLQIYRMSGDGSTFVGNTSANRRTRAAAWHADGSYIPIERDGSSGSAYAASHDGSVIVGTSTCTDLTEVCPGETMGAIWRNGISPPEGLSSVEPRATSASGTVIVGGAAGRGFVSTNGAMLFVSEVTTFLNVSADGSTMDAQLTIDGATVSALFTLSQGIIDMGLPDSWRVSRVLSLNDDGSVVAGSAYNGEFSRPFRWTEGSGFSFLETLSETDDSCSVRGISGSGDTIIGNCGSNTYTQPVIWNGTNTPITVREEFDAQGIEYPIDFIFNVSFITQDGQTILGYSGDGDRLWRADLLDAR